MYLWIVWWYVCCWCVVFDVDFDVGEVVCIEVCV